MHSHTWKISLNGDNDFLSNLIAVCGKGGVGKSTFLALTLKILLSKQKQDILILDGDPDSNMPDLLGIKPKETVGHVMDQLVSDLEHGRVSPTADKERLIDSAIFNITTETPQFDMFILGSLESDGCYCPLTHNLSRVLGRNIDSYDYSLLDLPAGLEHINRGLIKDVNTLFVVLDGSRLSISTLKRIIHLTNALKSQPGRFVAIANRVSEEVAEVLKEAVEDLGIVFGGWLPRDEQVEQINRTEGALLDISEEAPALVAATRIINQFVMN
ncbi:MAG: nucleotide-binding protein [Candidatus Hodarchaeales archaeon]